MSNSSTKNWYAIYTKANAEQTLDRAIRNHSKRYHLGYETYLPMRTEQRYLRNLIRTCKKPLFSNYLFVKHDQNAFFKVKNMKGFKSYVCTGIKPSKIPEEQMEIIKKITSHQVDLSSQSSIYTKGQPIRINRGGLAGYEGVLIEDAQKNKVAIEIKSLGLFMCVRLPVSDLAMIA